MFRPIIILLLCTIAWVCADVTTPGIDPRMLSGPYLTFPSATQCSIHYRIAGADLSYGKTPAYEGGSVPVGSTSVQHVTVPNLQPGDTLYYKFSIGTELLAADCVPLWPLADESFRVAFVGDFGTTNAATQRIAHRIDEANPRLLMTVGDNVYESGLESEYDPHLFTPYKNLLRRTPIMPAAGNHDLSNRAVYERMFDLPRVSQTAQHYDFEYGPAHFVVIDTVEAQTPLGDPSTYLERTLSRSTKPWKIVVLHHNMVTSEFKHRHIPLLRQRIVPVLEAHGVQLVLQGHNHAYERINAIGGVNYLTTGAGGHSLHPLTNRLPFSATYNNTEYSFVALDVSEDQLIARCIDENGVEFDAIKYMRDPQFTLDGIDREGLGSQSIHHALSGPHMYLSTPDLHPETPGRTTHLYLGTTTNGTVSAPTGFNHQVPPYEAVLEAKSGFGAHQWIDQIGVSNKVQTFTSMRSGDTNQAVRIIEGAVQLADLYGKFPREVVLSLARYDGSNLIQQAQAVFSPRPLVSDFPPGPSTTQYHVAIQQPTTLGLTTATNYPQLTYQWSQLSGSDILLSAATNPSVVVQLDQPITQPTNYSFAVTLQDYRFCETNLHHVIFEPSLDTDLDGLTDYEETTGTNLVSSPLDPAGHLTNPFVADSDFDGANDGAESIAGTDPNDGDSRFALSVSPLQSTGLLEIWWPSATNRSYTLFLASSAEGPYQELNTVPATPPDNHHSVPQPTTGTTWYYKIRVTQP